MIYVSVSVKFEKLWIPKTFWTRKDRKLRFGSYILWITNMRFMGNSHSNIREGGGQKLSELHPERGIKAVLSQLAMWPFIYHIFNIVPEITIPVISRFLYCSQSENLYWILYLKSEVLFLYKRRETNKNVVADQNTLPITNNPFIWKSLSLRVITVDPLCSFNFFSLPHLHQSSACSLSSTTNLVPVAIQTPNTS